MDTRTFAIHTLGCKVNTYESDLMAERLRAAGLREVPFTGAADIYIVNTCTVTHIADKKSRQMLRRARKLSPGAFIVAAGCYVDDASRAGTLRGLIEEGVIDIALPNSAKASIASFIPGIDVNATAAAPPAAPAAISSLSGHSRAFIKIQDGCNMFCSYCVIPYVRGRLWERPREETLSEVRALASGGVAEVVLTGIHVSGLGDSLIDTIEEVAAVDGIKRVRLSSLEPGFITRERVERLRAVPGLCPHFHLSLQSGSDRVLYAMHRHYTRAQYLAAVELIREYFEHPAITTDIIVGFPGESEEDFLETLDFARELGLYEAHVFRYSRREGTPAASMPGQLTEEVKAHRSERLIALCQEMSEQFRGYYLGKKIAFLSEELVEIDGALFETGYTPEYVRAAAPTDTLHQNRIIEGVADRPALGGERPRGGDILIVRT